MNDNDNDNDYNKRKIIPLTQWNDHHPWPSQSGLRYLVFHSNDNGFDQVIRRSGRRVLIDEHAFFMWLDEQNNAPA